MALGDDVPAAPGDDTPATAGVDGSAMPGYFGCPRRKLFRSHAMIIQRVFQLCPVIPGDEPQRYQAMIFRRSQAMMLRSISRNYITAIP